jgi:hypothetical protein
MVLDVVLKAIEVLQFARLGLEGFGRGLSMLY